MIKVKYHGIDLRNRPVFKSENGLFYGCTGMLFPYNAPEKEVLEMVTETDLTLFGDHFNCEPAGDPTPELVIERS